MLVIQFITFIRWRKFSISSLLRVFRQNVFSCVQLFANSWTISTTGSSGLGDFPGKNTGVCCHALLQEIFPDYGSNLGLLQCRQILYHLSHQGSPNNFVEIAKIVTSWNEHLTFSRERPYQVLWIHSVPVLQMHYFHFPNIPSSHQPQGLCTCCYL